MQLGKPLMESWSDRYWTSSDGLKLHYRDYSGPGDRPPVICLHGLTRNARDFESLADHLAGDWRTIVPDFRGRGMSEYDRDSSRYIPPVYSADILKLLDELGIEAAVFVGTSLGGIVTMVLAAFAPERIAGTVLNDIGPELDKEGVERIGSYVGRPLRFASWDDAVGKLSEKYGDVHPGYGRDEWLRYAKRTCRQGKTGVEFDYDMAIAEPFKQANSGPAADIWPLFNALADKPLLILRGENSDLFSAEAARKMCEAAPAAELVTVPDVAHAPDLEEPESIAAIDRLLNRVLDR